VALQQAYNIVQNGLLSKINAATVPFLAQLVEPGEKPSQARRNAVEMQPRRSPKCSRDAA